MSTTAITAKLLTTATTAAVAPDQLEQALEVVATLHDRRRPAGYFLTAELATVPALVDAGIVRRFRDGREEWLELDDDALEARAAEEAAAPEGIVPLERALAIRNLTGTATVLPAGTFVGLASTLDDDVLALLVDGRALVGEAPRTAILDALEPKPADPLVARIAGASDKRLEELRDRHTTRHTAALVEAELKLRPVRDLGVRLERIARNAERGAGWRRDLEELVLDLKRSGRPAMVELGRRLEQAAGKRGSRAASGAGRRIRALL